MRIGAVMPTYNQAEYLEAAVESLLPMVDELAIVDDGSTDETPEILSRRWPTYTVTHKENLGTAAAINTGVDVVRMKCDWLTWASSDNTYTKDWRGYVEGEALEGVGVVYTGYLRCNEILQPIRPAFTAYKPGKLISNPNCFIGPSFIVDREVWIDAGPQRGLISHDYDHWLRIEESCAAMGLAFRSVQQFPCLYRVHDARVTVTRADQNDSKQWQAAARKRRARKSRKQ